MKKILVVWTFVIGVLFQILGLALLVASYNWHWEVLLTFGPSYPVSYWMCQVVSGLMIIAMVGFNIDSFIKMNSKEQ